MPFRAEIVNRTVVDTIVRAITSSLEDGTARVKSADMEILRHEDTWTVEQALRTVEQSVSILRLATKEDDE